MVTSYHTLTREESAFFVCYDVHKISAVNCARNGNEAGMEKEILALEAVYSFFGRKMPDVEVQFIRRNLKKIRH